MVGVGGVPTCTTHSPRCAYIFICLRVHVCVCVGTKKRIKRLSESSHTRSLTRVVLVEREAVYRGVALRLLFPTGSLSLFPCALRALP
jgi:hypothetical protein